MTDDGGRSIFLQKSPVPRETLRMLDAYADMVLAENANQNLIAKSTEGDFWTRHILDSAQLLPQMPANARTCLDVGSGAGLPGIVLATMSDVRFTLVEPRRRRAEFLQTVARSLGLDERVSVLMANVERVAHDAFDIVTARALANLSATIEAARHLAGAHTVWLLPKGRTVADELAEAKRRWSADFEIIPSLTDPDAAIVKVSGLQPGQSK